MVVRFASLVVLVDVMACSDSPTDPPSGGDYTIGGTLLGLEGKGLVLSNGGSDAITPDIGPFTFPTALSTGETYDVTVETQPSNPPQTCTVQNGSGTVGTANVTDVAVTCN